MAFFSYNCNRLGYRTITTFDAPDKNALEDTVGKGENAGNQHIHLFP